VRYFERLAKKEGSGQKAIRKMVREDGSERSLKDLERLYGKPRDITIRTKTAKPVAKPVGFERRLVDSSFDQLRKDGRSLIDEVGGLDPAKFRKLESDFKQAAANVNSNLKPELQAGLIAKFDKAADSLTSYRVSFTENLEKLRNKMLETSLTDVQVNKFVNQVSISSSFNGPQQAQIKNYFSEYVRMFNGAGFTEAANGVPAVNKIGKASRGSCRFWKGTFTTGVNRQGVVSKSTTFHEITHVVEVANPKLNNGMNKWKFDKAFGEKGKLGLKKEVREKFLAKPNSRANYDMTEKLEKPVYKLKTITGNRGYKEKELAFVNEYKDAYMGKVYDMYDYSFDYIKGTINPSEVLTMSVETFADVEKMQTLIQKHPDLFELVVGMSRAANL